MGSTHTLWYTFDMRSAVGSQISLCRTMGNPPVWQFKAWSMVNDLPHAHVVGNRGGCHPYLKQRASRKAPWCSKKQWLSIGSATNQLEEPFSFATSISFWSFVEAVGEGCWQLPSVLPFSCSSLSLCIAVVEPLCQRCTLRSARRWPPQVVL